MAADPSGFVYFFTVVMFLLGGGEGDLLDYVSTEGYWQAKSVQVSPAAMLKELGPPGAAPDFKRQIDNLGSDFDKVRQMSAAQIAAAGAAALEQLEVAAQSSNAVQAAEARRLIEQIKAAGQAGPVRKLMAIRTLGEMRHRVALPALNELAGSATPFVGAYARRAIAAMDGAAPKPDEQLAAKLESDLAVLPASSGMVAQYRPGALRHLSLKELAKYGGRRLPQDPEVRRQKIELKLIDIAERVGNARLDGITLSLSDDLANRSGHVVIIGRGQFDMELVRAFARAGRLTESRVGNLDVFRSNGQEGAVIVPSNQCMVFVAGIDRPNAAPIDELIAAVQAGKGKIGENKEMAAMIQAADKSGPIWGVTKVSEGYRGLFPGGVLTGVESGVLSSTVKDGKVQLALRAKAKDADSAKAAMAAFGALWQQFLAEGQREAAREPGLTPLIDALRGITYKADGDSLHADAQTADLMPGRFMLPIFLIEIAHELGLRD
ncbi:MAG: hypothetical protein WD042_16730 [Phycisphaeraceae bacterium]